MGYYGGKITLSSSVWERDKRKTLQTGMETRGVIYLERVENVSCLFSNVSETLAGKMGSSQGSMMWVGDINFLFKMLHGSTHIPLPNI